MKIIITGGHHSSAIPVIKRLKELYPDIELFWFGHRKSLKGDKNDTLEYLEISSLGIPFYDLKAGKVYKTFDIGRLLKIPYGFFQSLSLLIKIKPDAILSFGGYLAVPVVLAGWLLHIPSITHEQTVVVGYANKLIAFFAKKILISFPQSQENFSKNKTVLSGIPIRKEIGEVRSNDFEVNNNLPTIYTVGGKTGSHKINTLVLDSLSELLSFCNVIHQCGDNSVFNDYDNLVKEYEKIKNNLDEKPGRYHARKFIMEDEIGEAYHKANLVIARAGAHTIGELLALQKPSLLIPIAWVSHNEQNLNALFLANAGLSKIMEEKGSNKEIFIKNIKHVLDNVRDFYLKDRSLLNLLKSDSADIIINELIKITKKS